MAVTPPQGAGPADAPRRVRWHKVVRAATAAVLVAGLVLTGVLAAITFRGHQRTEHTLLNLQTTLIADAGEAEDQLYVEGAFRRLGLGFRRGTGLTDDRRVSTGGSILGHVRELVRYQAAAR